MPQGAHHSYNADNRSQWSPVCRYCDLSEEAGPTLERIIDIRSTLARLDVSCNALGPLAAQSMAASLTPGVPCSTCEANIPSAPGAPCGIPEAHTGSKQEANVVQCTARWHQACCSTPAGTWCPGDGWGYAEAVKCILQQMQLAVLRCSCNALLFEMVST